MKGLKLSLVIIAAALLTIGLSGMAYAFHDGGVADCSGCHSMHSPADTDQKYLLTHQDASSTCLDCHSGATLGSHSVMTYPVPAANSPPVNYTPGGDFAWLLKPYTWTGRSGSPTTESGMSHGHNVVAGDFGITADNELPAAPGGTFLSTNLGCPSCHDPHGKYRRDSTGAFSKTGAPISASGSTGNTPAPGLALGSYRLLAGQDYSQNAGAIAIPYPGVPVAVSPSTYNRSESATQTRVAYGVGTDTGTTTWGHWCGACHPNYHSTGNYVHPIDQGLGATVSTNYGKYVYTGKVDGAAASSYLSLVPFIQNTNAYNLLLANAKTDNSALGGPGSSDQVSCVSCHRGHASGFPFAIRWQPEYEMITVSVSGAAVYPGTDTVTSADQSRGRTSAEVQAAYYGRPATTFGAVGYQRSLCNKCHIQD